jgi:hypothetical protein
LPNSVMLEARLTSIWPEKEARVTDHTIGVEELP